MQAECWGDDDLDEALQQVQQSSAGGEASLRRISVGIDHACALRATSRAGSGAARGDSTESAEVSGQAVCWGSNWLNPELAEANAQQSEGELGHIYVGKAVARGADMVDISAGADHTCGITTHGQIQCWGHAISDTGVPTGNHWMRIKAANGRTCAVSQLGSGVLACWGHSGRNYLDQINAGAFALLPRTLQDGSMRRADKLEHGARVRHYGPDLSSLEHLDGTWLHVLPADLSLERDPFITILSPDVSGANAPSYLNLSPQTRLAN